jgi:hypothetical protein
MGKISEKQTKAIPCTAKPVKKQAATVKTAVKNEVGRSKCWCKKD